MTFIYRAHPLADAELTAAARWYENQQPGLGLDFLEAAENTVRKILDGPHVAPAFPGCQGEPVVRARNFTRFPYRALYYVTDEELTVFAFSHHRRDPNYWADRL